MKLGLATLCLILAACGNGEEPERAAARDPLLDPDAHNGPNGGHVLMLGNEEAFIEVKVNHHNGTVLLWVYKDRKMEEIVAPDEEPVFNFVSKAGPMQLVGEDNDESWLFWDDDVLKEEPKSARFRVKIKGKTFSPPFVHSHAKPASPAPASEGE
jgi:hypothetical protein